MSTTYYTYFINKLFNDNFISQSDKDKYLNIVEKQPRTIHLTDEDRKEAKRKASKIYYYKQILNDLINNHYQDDFHKQIDKNISENQLNKLLNKKQKEEMINCNKIIFDDNINKSILEDEYSRLNQQIRLLAHNFHEDNNKPYMIAKSIGTYEHPLYKYNVEIQIKIKPYTNNDTDFLVEEPQSIQNMYAFDSEGNLELN